MINKLNLTSDFSKNVLTLMTGTTIAQVIPIAISPILTRIYTPSDFGIFALFLAISSIFASIANGRYELAIMLPKKDEDAINIVALGFIITTILSLILLILVVLFNESFTKLLNNDEIGIWLYFIPFSVFFAGVFNILNYFNTRKKNYKDIANATIIKSVLAAIIQLSVGFLKNGASGLISGQIVAQVFANMRLVKNIIKDKQLISKINRNRIIFLAKKYKDFPKFSVGAILANKSSFELTNILISIFYSVTTLGYYSLVQRVLGMPSALIGQSMNQVFFQEATKEKQKTGKAEVAFYITFKKLLLISLPVFGLLYFVIKDIFIFVFGEAWKIAGEYSEVLVFFFFVRFISASLSSTIHIFEKQKVSLFINIWLAISSIGLVFLSLKLSWSFEAFLEAYTFIMCINYSALLLYYYKLSKGLL